MYSSFLDTEHMARSCEFAALNLFLVVFLFSDRSKFELYSKLWCLPWTSPEKMDLSMISQQHVMYTYTLASQQWGLIGGRGSNVCATRGDGVQPERKDDPGTMIGQLSASYRFVLPRICCDAASSPSLQRHTIYHCSRPQTHAPACLMSSIQLKTLV